MPPAKRANAYGGRANCWLMLRQPDEAIADYTRALDLDPNDIASYRHRAQVYEDKADFAAAIADLDRAIEIAGPDADAPLFAQRAHVHLFRR